MRLFIIDTRNMGPELQGGMIGVVGSLRPSLEEKRDCIETISRYVIHGWAVAADPTTPIGLLAALTAEAACAPFLTLSRALDRSGSIVRALPDVDVANQISQLRSSGPGVGAD